jgi:phosphoglycolate phosphatase
MKPDLIIFDLDGTLVDTVRDIADALNAACAPHGLRPFTLDETRDMVGQGMVNLIARALGPGRAALVEPTLREFVRIYSTGLAVHSRPYPGVPETLAELARSFRMAVLSNKSQALSRELLAALGLARWFELIEGGDSVPEKKPSPRAVTHVLDALGVAAHDAVVVGDSAFDVDAAQGAGVRAVGVTYGFRPRASIAHADALVDRFADLPRVLGG